ncbi:hypothetical protein [Phytohabitans houttuyneae]
MASRLPVVTGLADLDHLPAALLIAIACTTGDQDVATPFQSSI